MAKKIWLILILTLTFFSGKSQVLIVSVSGNASFDNSAYLVTEAGVDFPSNVESETSLFVSVEYETGFWGYLFYPDKKWRIFIHKTDMNWNNDLKLAASRIGTGNLAFSWRGQPLFIRDGTNFQNISNNPTYFFRGRHGITSIPVKFRLSGASLTMGAQQFETSVVFTVYDDW